MHNAIRALVCYRLQPTFQAPANLEIVNNWSHSVQNPFHSLSFQRIPSNSQDDVNHLELKSPSSGRSDARGPVHSGETGDGLHIPYMIENSRSGRSRSASNLIQLIAVCFDYANVQYQVALIYYI